MLVAVDHGHVMPYFVLENMLRYANGMFVILGGLVGLTWGVVCMFVLVGVVVGCMVCDFGLDVYWSIFCGVIDLFYFIFMED